MNGELKGVGGWLAFFILVLAVISPVINSILTYLALYSAEMAALAFTDFWPSIQLFEWSVVGLGALIGWFAAYRLYQVHNWLSVQIAIAAVWIIGLGLSVLEVFGVSYFTGLPADLLLSAAQPQDFIRPFIFGIVWTAYLLKSERVANTYRGGEEQAEVFE